MFWVKSSAQYEPNLKFRFIAEFVFTDLASNVKGEPNLMNHLVKSITAPSINIDFERAYANQYVHYFQNGSIHWEPVQIVLYDYASKNKDNVLSNRLFKYLRDNKILSENRTQVIDLPIFCKNILINEIVGFENNSNLNVQETIRNIQSNEYKTQQYFNIINPRINKIDFGSYDYGSDEINTITLTLIPEWCTNLEDQDEQRVSTVAQDSEPNENIDYNFDEETPSQQYKDPFAYYGGLGGDPFEEAQSRKPQQLKDK